MPHMNKNKKPHDNAAVFYQAQIKINADYLTGKTDSLLSTLNDGTFLSCGIIRSPTGTYAPWTLQIQTNTKPNPDALTAHIKDACKILNILPDLINGPWTIEYLKNDTDWTAHSQKQNPPLIAPPFFVYPSHYTGEIDDTYIPLNIDALTAFGSGHHGTTKGCLSAMGFLKEQGVCPWNILDMGTGSGILALAAWKLWKTPVLGIDIDAECINVCRQHAAQNQISLKTGELTFRDGNGFQTDAVQQKKPFDLIIANIQPAPLKHMATDLKSVCDENGYVILSGIMHEEAESVIAVYKNHNLHLHRRIEIEAWSTLILHNRS